MNHRLAIIAIAALGAAIFACSGSTAHVTPAECEPIAEACHPYEDSGGKAADCHVNAETKWTAAECNTNKKDCLAACPEMSDGGTDGGADGGKTDGGLADGGH